MTAVRHCGPIGELIWNTSVRICVKNLVQVSQSVPSLRKTFLLSRDYNCDSTTIRLRYDYDEKLTC